MVGLSIFLLTQATVATMPFLEPRYEQPAHYSPLFERELKQ